ncbi:MAG TPA: ROK family transcriptional regulator [Actinocrinis sp.]|jgi:predicted NBD/HSP70 family sugar kinase
MRWGAGSVAGDMTRTAVLALLARQGPLSRAQIAERLDLSRATVTQTTRRLLGQGLVGELDRRPAQSGGGGGRPSVPLSLVPQAAHALGVQVAHEHVSGVLTRLDAAIVDRFRQPFDPAAPDAVAELVELIRHQLDEAARQALPVMGVGVTVPGVVDPRTGTLRMSVRLGWTGMPLAARLRAELGVPVLVDNDISAVTAAERLYGPGADCADFLLVAIGQGVGLGMVLDGAPYRGAAGAAGEFGHLPVVPDGLPCACGNRGCLETLVSTESLLRQAIRLGLVAGPDGRAGGAGAQAAGLARLREAADRGEPAAARLLADAGTVLGRALAGSVNLLGPDTVVIMGEIMVLWPHLAGPFRAALDAGLLPCVRRIRIDVRAWDDSQVAFGAAGIVLAAPLAVPRQMARQV